MGDYRLGRGFYQCGHGLVFIALAVLSSLISCEREPAESPAPDTLPAVGELSSNPRQDTPVVAAARLDQAPSAAVMQGGDVFGKFCEYRLHGGEQPAWLVFEAGPFYPGDKIESIAVIASGLGEERLAYKIALADHGVDEWRYSALVTQAGRQPIDLPDIAVPFDEQGYARLAVAVESGAAINLHLVQWQLILVSGEAVQIRASLLEREAQGVPVAIGLTALDSDGRIAKGFSQSGALLIQSTNGATNLDVTFESGRASPRHTFPATGEYGISLTGFTAGLDTDLGTVTIYETRLPIYSVEIKDKHLQALEIDPDSDAYLPAKLCIGAGEYTAGLRLRGSTSRRNQKRNWKLKLPEAGYPDGEWGYERSIINLGANYRDATMLHEVLSYDLLQQLGVPVPRTRFVHLRINGVFQGVYSDIENPRRSWLRQCGLSDQGSLFKAVMEGGVAVSAADDYNVRGFEQKLGGNDGSAELEELFSELTRLEQLTDEEAYQGLAELFDLDVLNAHFTGLRLIGSYDNWYQNYYLYHDSAGTGKWVIFPWDLDLTWGVGPLSLGNSTLEAEPVADFELEFQALFHPLTRLYHGNPYTRQQLKAGMLAALEDQFAAEALIPRIENYAALIGPDVAAEWQAQSSFEVHRAQVGKLKRYVRDRCEFIRTELDGF